MPRSHPALLRALALATGALIVGALILAQAGGRSGQAISAADPAARGLEQWRRHRCGTCHAIYGLGGHLGPDLTNAARRRDAAYLRYVLRFGVGNMPGLGLNEAEAGEVLAYLRHLDGLGTYPLPSPRAPAFGINR